MKLTGTLLKWKFPKLVYLSCLTHGLHNVCENMKSYPLVNKFIVSAKQILTKLPNRANKYINYK